MPREKVIQLFFIIQSPPTSFFVAVINYCTVFNGNTNHVGIFPRFIVKQFHP